mmetsp:Transcript_22070/g.86798  ORF Transcript_22070/g.86798 Transcript_22070/m.86798 type:complete len:523 (-) Transcript_22070:1686-3254(-)
MCDKCAVVLSPSPSSCLPLLSHTDNSSSPICWAAESSRLLLGFCHFSRRFLFLVPLCLLFVHLRFLCNHLILLLFLLVLLLRIFHWFFVLHISLPLFLLSVTSGLEQHSVTAVLGELRPVVDHLLLFACLLLEESGESVLRQGHGRLREVHGGKVDLLHVASAVRLLRKRRPRSSRHGSGRERARGLLGELRDGAGVGPLLVPGVAQGSGPLLAALLHLQLPFRFPAKSVEGVLEHAAVVVEERPHLEEGAGAAEEGCLHGRLVVEEYDAVLVVQPLDEILALEAAEQQLLEMLRAHAVVQLVHVQRVELAPVRQEAGASARQARHWVAQDHLGETLGGRLALGSAADDDAARGLVVNHRGLEAVDVGQVYDHLAVDARHGLELVLVRRGGNELLEGALDLAEELGHRAGGVHQQRGERRLPLLLARRAGAYARHAARLAAVAAKGIGQLLHTLLHRTLFVAFEADVSARAALLLVAVGAAAEAKAAVDSAAAGAHDVDLRLALDRRAGLVRVARLRTGVGA